jgi:hypothetical protein
MPSSLRRDKTRREVRESTRLVQRLNKLVTPASSSDPLAWISEAAPELHRFMMIDEDLLRCAVLR